mgnify:CR=1 FL=1
MASNGGATAVSEFEALRPHLQPMTGNVLYLGDPAGRAAAFKLFGNLAIIGLNGVLGDVARLAEGVGIAPADAFTLFAHFNPGANMTARAARIARRSASTRSSTTRMAPIPACNCIRATAAPR